MKRAFFDKTSRNIVQKVVILCDFHVTETYGHIIVTRKYCIFMQDVVILHSKIRDKRRLAVNLLYFLRARCFTRCSVKRKKEVKLLERIPKDAFGIEIV